jgi:copper chaperone
MRREAEKRLAGGDGHGKIFTIPPRFKGVMAMQTEKFRVKNVKCGGCANTIRQGLMNMPGVKGVDVVIPGGEVTVSGEDLRREVLAQKLGQLGYPEGR